MRRAVIILPTFNESKNIKQMIRRIFDVAKTLKNWDLHIVVTDSDSPDGTAGIVESLLKTNNNLHLIRTEKKGLGQAYIEGFKISIEKLKPYVLFEMDADLSHQPECIPEFLKKIEQGADFVIGSRYTKGGSIPKDWAFYRKFLSVIGNLVIRFGFMKLRITDWTSGYRAMKVWIVKESLPKLANYTGYVFQVALLDSAIKSQARINEVPIQFIDRKEGYSKINSTQYTIQTLLYVFQYSQFIKFCIVGGIGFIIDYGISHIFIDLLHKAVWFSTIISAESAIISNFLFNNFWSFSHKRVKEGFVWSFLKFNSIAVGSIAIQATLMELSSIIFGREHWPIYKFFIILTIIIPYSYFFYNRVVWKDK